MIRKNIVIANDSGWEFLSYTPLIEAHKLILYIIAYSLGMYTKKKLHMF